MLIRSLFMFILGSSAAAAGPASIEFTGRVTFASGPVHGIAGGLTATIGVNDCHRTYLDATPMVLIGHLDANAPIDIVIQSGPAASPNSNYGTGGNVRSLYVR